jgi:hypothetical protein
MALGGSEVEVLEGVAQASSLLGALVQQLSLLGALVPASSLLGALVRELAVPGALLRVLLRALVLGLRRSRRLARVHNWEH